MIKLTDFKTDADLFAHLRTNKALLIEEKKAEIYKSHEKGLGLFSNQEAIKKSLEVSKAFKMEDDSYYFVVNSANILDSHYDVHVKGNWDKTVKEQQGKVYLVFDHQLKRSEIIAMKQDIEMFTAEIPFSMIGKAYEGNTYCLIYKVKKDRIVNSEAKEWLEKGYDLEASVRMQYVQLDMALNSKDANDVKEKETFDKYYELIANKKDFQEIKFFFVVKEAKNVYESSLVMFGSNGATGLIEQENKEEPSNHSEQKEEPTIVTQEVTRKRSLLI